MATTIDLSLTGCVNGAPVAVISRALLEPGRIELDLGADPSSFLFAGTVGFETDWGGAYSSTASTLERSLRS